MMLGWRRRWALILFRWFGRLWRFWFLMLQLWLFRTWLWYRLFNFIIFILLGFFISFLFLVWALYLMRVWRFYLTCLRNLTWFLIPISWIRWWLRYRFFNFFFSFFFWNLLMRIISNVWRRKLRWRIVDWSILWNFSFTCIIALSNLWFVFNMRTLLFRNSIWLTLNMFRNSFLFFWWNFFLMSLRFCFILLSWRVLFLIRISTFRLWLDIMIFQWCFWRLIRLILRFRNLII